MTDEWTYEKLLAKYREELKQFQFITKKEMVTNLAKKLEETGMPKDMISAKLIEDLKGYDVGSDYIRQCLGEEFTQKSKRRERFAMKNAANDVEKPLELSTNGRIIEDKISEQHEIIEGYKQRITRNNEEIDRVTPVIQKVKELQELLEQEKDGRKVQELENGKLKEQLTEQKKILDETIKSVNAGVALNKNKNIPVTDSLEYKALESEIYILQQENKDLKQIAQMQMKQNPGETFKPASEIPSKYTDSPSLLGSGRFEIEFPARELSTLWADARIARQIMYLKIEGNKVVGWESDAQRAKNQAREAAKPA